MGQTKTTRSISATGLFLLIMMTVGLYSCTRTQKDIIQSSFVKCSRFQRSFFGYKFNGIVANPICFSF